MQKYKPKTMLAAFSDRILRVLATSAAGIAWFVYLWGLSLPALAAGLALGGLLWLCARQFGKRSTQKREKQMRCMIGGELAVDTLLLESARKAAFQAALWISPRYPVVMHKAVEWGVIGTLDGKATLIRLVTQHPSQPVSAQRLVECAREMKARRMAFGLICLTAPASRDAILYAAACDPPMQLIAREELIELAGLCNPATDEDLRRLGRQKRTRRSAREWLAVILDPSRARRYLGYGLGLGTLAVLTGLSFYPVPAAVCLTLYLACKLRALTRRRRWQERSTP